MRPLAFIVLLLATSGVLRAQEQERKLMDRILQPDMSLGNPMQGKTYYSGNASGLDTTRTADVKDFYFSQKFSAKAFETKDFAAKDFWQGDFQFSTKSANVKSASEGDKIYETKSATVKDARENAKTYDTHGYATREAVEKGKTSQAHLNEKYLGKPEMNMDQVRDLLNKNHKASLAP
jgi:hypothetical protein